MKHTGTIVLETERLTLRPFQEQDADLMYKNWASNPAVTKYLTWTPHRNLQETQQIISEWIKMYENPDRYNWCIVDRSTGEPVGSISVVEQNKEVEAAELGYCLSQDYWGQDLMVEAVKAVTVHLLLTVGFNRVFAHYDSLNKSSGRVLEKAGFLFEGTCRAAGKNNRGIVDLVQYAILQTDIHEKDGFSLPIDT